MEKEFQNNRETGTEKERIAANYLERQGMRILEKNFRCHFGEIDLIGSQKGYLVFVEVKYRKSNSKGYALEAVGKKKQKVICKVSKYYCYTHGISGRQAVRYDVVAIQGDRINWIPNAFWYQA